MHEKAIRDECNKSFACRAAIGACCGACMGELAGALAPYIGHWEPIAGVIAGSLCSAAL